MTQEELIKKIDAEITKLSDNACLMAIEDGGYRVACMDISDMLHKIAKEIQPSLPSNLDEAAEEYAYNNWEDNDYHTGASEGLPFDAIGHTEKCFKAGAEWMAGQFQKIEGELVDWYSSPEGKDYCCGVKTIDSFEVPEGFYIRKKK